VWRAPTLQGNWLYAAAVSDREPQITVAAGQLGAVVRREGSGDWTAVRLPYASIGEVFWAGSGFIAIANDTAGRMVVLRSVDGLSWSESAVIPAEVALISPAASGARIGKWLLIGGSGSQTRVSTDWGSSWKAGPSLPAPFDGMFKSYTGLAVNVWNTWVAVGTGGTVTTSLDDGGTWTRHQIASSTDFYHVFTDGRAFVALGFDSLHGKASPWVAYRSDDGVAWSRIPQQIILPQGQLDNFGVGQASAGKFVLSSQDADWRTVFVQSVDGGKTWTRLAGADERLGINAGVVLKDGTFCGFGQTGLVVTAAPGSGETELVSQPYLGNWVSEFYSSAGANGAFVAIDGNGGKKYFSADGSNFEMLSASGAVATAADAFLRARPDDSNSDVSGEVFVVETSQDGADWDPVPGVATLPEPENDAQWRAVGLSRRPPDGNVIVLLAKSRDEQTVLNVLVWNGTSWQTSAIPDATYPSYDGGPGPEQRNIIARVEWDPHGQRFLLLTPRGMLLSSGNGSTWQPLTSLPQDLASYISANYKGKANVPIENVIFSFAVGNNGTLVARSCKLVGGSVDADGPDRFFVLPPGGSAWTQVQPPAAAAERYNACNIIWNGSDFVSANAAGYLRTSPNGYVWKKRQLGADVKFFTWTGSRLVAMTGWGGILTHSTGLSADEGRAQSIAFRLPPRMSVRRSYILGARASSGLRVSYEVSDSSIASLAGNRLTVLKAQPFTITARQQGDEQWSAALPVTLAADPTKQSQRISLLVASVVRVGQFPRLRATANSGLPVSVTSSNPDVFWTDGVSSVALNPGKVTLTATQSGDDVYLPANPVSRVVTVR